MAGLAGGVWQMVERLSAVSALDTGRRLGTGPVRAQRQRGKPRSGSDDRQHRYPGPSLGSWRKRGTQRQGFGRSKGGFTTKIHLIANAHGLPVRAEISGGEVSDFKGFDALVDDDLPEARVFIADRGYDSDHIRSVIARRGGTPVIPGRANRKEPILVDGITYALRNRVERCFNKLKCSRRMATRYDKTADSYLGFIHIAAARIWVRSLST